METEIIQINITGEDRPGVTTAMMKVLGEHNAHILDIGQANIHHSLSLAIMFEARTSNSGNIMKDLLLRSCELGVVVRFSPITKDNYSTWVNLQGKNRYIITVLGRELTAEQISKVTDIMLRYKMNIEGIDRLSGRVPLEDEKKIDKSCIEFSVRGVIEDVDQLRKSLWSCLTNIILTLHFNKKQCIDVCVG